MNWLREHRDELGPVIDADLETKRPLIFDLSVGSSELSPWKDPEDMQELSALISSQMAAAGAQVGVGRYDEARHFYTSDIFKTAGNDSAEWRTVHLGMDLHLDPGSAVFAPLDGAVHSFADNSGRLDYGPTIILEHTITNGPKFYTLYGHLSRESLAGLIKGAEFKRETPSAASAP